MNRSLLLSLLCLLAFGLSGQQLESFPLSAVSLDAGPFLRAQQTDLDYIMEMDPDRLLAPYLREAGMEPDAESYGNWENTGLDGHIGGHYISALSLMYASTWNEAVHQRLTYMLDRLQEAQEKNGNGYIGGIPNSKPLWEEIEGGDIRAGAFSLNDRWVPLYNIHKIFAGLRDAYAYAGSEQAREMLIELSDWFLATTEELSDEQMQDMLRSEHGGLNEVFADVYAYTGDEKYLDLARRLSHEVVLDPLLVREDHLTGMHANTQIPKVIGFERVAQVSGDTSWTGGADYFWRTIVEDRTVSIGGNSVREHFHPADDFSSMIASNQGPETCNTYNMLRLTKMLYLDNPSPEYIDYYERAMYNHILSSQHPEGGFVYFTPMRPRHYRVYSQPQQGFWCCVGSGLENHGKYGELIYAHTDEDVYVNLFVASTLDWQEKGLQLRQLTDFPYQAGTEMELSLDEPSRFSLHVRHPGWVNEGDFAVTVNGEPQTVTTDEAGFVTIDREWQTGDRISVSLPMHTEAEYLPDDSPWASFVYGPVVLAAATGTEGLDGLFADDSRMGHVATGEFLPLDEAPMLVQNGGKLSSQVNALPGDSLRFSIAHAATPEGSEKILLQPFFEVHDSRYMLYWRVTDPDELQQIQEDMRREEVAMLALEAATVDEVAAGEQQPETEHDFAGQETDNGSTDEGKSWRAARGWFSYRLSNPDGEGKLLRITHEAAGPPRAFDVLIDDQVVETVRLPGSREGGTETLDIKLPEAVLKRISGDAITLKIAAGEESNTGRIYDIRLLKEE
ncbi:glycoside hydrolase family 127 protein [Lewinella sp. IMCC34191]|uniref:glycoside hydrolase family 127 protein n=1 Tax=Lewinella sp. IMCC34191 TaxID=2259172 RepID=UPI000E22CC49|nr:glycoside hydrolase family 127 protein [Lewinella sp. IMCC34191]